MLISQLGFYHDKRKEWLIEMIRIGIICPSEIAYRRFMPALNSIPDLQFIGLAVSSTKERLEYNLSPEQSQSVEIMISEQHKKASSFVEAYGGKIFDSYTEITVSDEIDALYIPLPPELHYRWAKLALENGKHVLVEKPSTTSYLKTEELVAVAQKNNLAFYENYMFIHHDQLRVINNYVEQGNLGDVRLYRIRFGFPKRALNDFRYNKLLGGGALFDAGGYTIKYASILLGETAKIGHAHLNYTNEFDVDLYGSATMINAEGVTAQIAFGMDNEYKCDLDIWGNKGSLHTGRILTAPPGYIPEASIHRGNETEIIKLPADDAFRKSLLCFRDCILVNSIRESNYHAVCRQAGYIQNFMDISKK
jgi:dTDP-3,4-didehydro-2,6-dideoxy-alpha-D-glucose 3-reductase